LKARRVLELFEGTTQSGASAALPAAKRPEWRGRAGGRGAAPIRPLRKRNNPAAQFAGRSGNGTSPTDITTTKLAPGMLSPLLTSAQCLAQRGACRTVGLHQKCMPTMHNYDDHRQVRKRKDDQRTKRNTCIRSMMRSFSRCVSRSLLRNLSGLASCF